MSLPLGFVGPNGRAVPLISCSAKNMPNERARRDHTAGIGGLFSAHPNVSLPTRQAVRPALALIDWK
jgi:hypothetical protein